MAHDVAEQAAGTVLGDATNARVRALDTARGKQMAPQAERPQFGVAAAVHVVCRRSSTVEEQPEASWNAQWCGFEKQRR